MNMPGYHVSWSTVEVQWWNRIVLLYQRAKRHCDGGKSECYIERCEAEHDYTLVQSNGFALKQGEKLSHSFNVKEIRCIEAKLTWNTQDMEALENNQKSSIFKGIHKQHINKRRRKKENHKKSNEGKRKQIESNVQRVYGICVFPQFLVHPPILAVP